MQTYGTNTLVDRMLGALRLDMNTYERVEKDTNATSQALTVVVIAGIATGIGALRADGVFGLISNTLGEIFGWIVFSFLTYWVGTKLLPSRETRATPGELLRTLGFAQTPQILSVFGFIPIIGALIGLVGAIWFILTSIMALRSALEMSIGRAVATAIVAGIAWLVVLLIFGLIFGTTVVFLSWLL